VGDSVRASVGASVRDSVGDSVRASVGASVRDSVGASVGDSVGDSGYGQHDANWLAFFEFFREVTDLQGETEKLSALIDLAHHAGWWLPHEKICWISERHNILMREDSGRLHDVSGPAVAYPDGWKIYAVHGVRVPAWVIEDKKSITSAKVDAEQNAEIRRVMIDLMGWPRYILDAGLQPIDERENFVEGTMEALYRCRDGSQRFVVTCPTARVFSLGIPNEITTCEQAAKWLGPQDLKVNLIGAT
jgi:hypothetical protein